VLREMRRVPVVLVILWSEGSWCSHRGRLPRRSSAAGRSERPRTATITRAAASREPSPRSTRTSPGTRPSSSPPGTSSRRARLRPQQPQRHRRPTRVLLVTRV